MQSASGHSRAPDRLNPHAREGPDLAAKPVGSGLQATGTSKNDQKSWTLYCPMLSILGPIFRAQNTGLYTACTLNFGILGQYFGHFGGPGKVVSYSACKPRGHGPYAVHHLEPHSMLIVGLASLIYTAAHTSSNVCGSLHIR